MLALFCCIGSAVSQEAVVQATNAPAQPEMTPLQLKLQFAGRSGLFPCADDPEEMLAVERGRVEVEFPLIQKDAELFHAVAVYLGMGKLTKFTADQQLLLHCYYRKTESVWLRPEGDKFRVVLESEAARGTAPDGGPVTYIDRHGNIMTVDKAASAGSMSGSLRDLKPPPPPAAPPETAGPKLTDVDTRLRLVRHFGTISFCTLTRPVSSREGYESLQRGDAAGVGAVRSNLGIRKGVALTAAQKAQIYTQYQKLQSMRIEKLATGHYFSLAIPSKKDINMQTRIEGIIDAHGHVMEMRRTPSAGGCPK